MSEECGVMVGVRVRPFNQREKDLNAVLCVEMNGPQTVLNPPPLEKQDEKAKEVKKFTFDASFWSHDGFEVDKNGYSYAKKGHKGTPYADQVVVFNKFGKAVLDNAWEGYHCCLFAYGQTGAGKSYSMVGYGANRGIVPMACEEIFTRIDKNKDPALKYEVLVSMIEIYNEQVQDLLIEPKLRSKKGLEIRENKQLGIYIDGVTKRPVDSYKAIEAAVDEGTTNRTVGATLMNATSSRAHTVNMIEFKQVSEAMGQTGCKVSMINLVDLAGSEKAGQTGASGDRLKEGCAINKSLSALGNVIEKLADKAGGKKGAVIPYRDSKLTRLLQNALGGSSKTVMICALSPASSNHEETLSTLRYADRAKRIKNSAVINENPQDKLIRQLREENAKLREMLGNQSPQEMQSTAGLSKEAIEEMERKQAEIAALEGALADISKSFKDRLAEAEAKLAAGEQAKQKQEADLTVPHIANLNDDMLLCNKLRFAFKDGVTKIGKVQDGHDFTGHAESNGQVILAGPGIHKDHAEVRHDKGVCTLVPTDVGTANTFVNGQIPKAEGKAWQNKGVKVVLNHGDRVAFGNCLFVFIDPAKGTAADLIKSGQVSYAMARKELADGGGDEQLEELKASKKKAEELEKQVKEAAEAEARARAEAEDLLKQREEEFNAKMASLQADWDQEMQAKQEAAASAAQAEATAAQAEESARQHQEQLEQMKAEFEEKQKQAEVEAKKQIDELEKKAHKAAAEEEDHKQRDLNMRLLEEQLMVAMPLVKEANLIASELKKPYKLETKMQVEVNGDLARGSISVTAAMTKEGVRLYEWSLDTLENRVFLMRELLQRCEEEGLEVAEELTNDDDPFWDPIESERLIGVAQASLKGLLMQVENQLDCRLLSTEVVGTAAPKQVGSLRVEVWPCAQDGSLGVPDEEVVDEAEELLGTQMTVVVKVLRASGLPEELAHDVRVEYDFFIDDGSHKIETETGTCCNPEFDYSKKFVQDPVTSRFIEYCDKKALVFRVYGSDTTVQRVKVEEEKAAEERQQAMEAKRKEEEEEQARLEEEARLEAEQLAAEEEAARLQAEAPSPPGENEPPGLPGAMDPPDQPTVDVPVPSLAQVRRGQEAAAEETEPPPLPPSGKKSKACSIL
eukprot:TRINITY_DN2586_c1_g4_i1.p1 TRINITY_DN2586_c1_g4~~TRINITY_DN2586_c1_g4_i1.p1  ORF type:complete len:1134 (+),score=428.70 TRINITY_DN2586_c1_g4_i1:175-3576(+)